MLVHGGGDVLGVVADTFQVGKHVQVNHAVLGGALLVLEALHMVLAQRFGQVVDGLLAVLHGLDGFAVIVLGAEHAHGHVQLLLDHAGETIQLRHRLGGKLDLLPLPELGCFQNVHAVVAHALQVVHHMEQGAYQPGVFLIKVKALHLHQTGGDFLVEEVQHVLVAGNFRGALLVPPLKAGHRAGEVAHGNIAHALHLVEQLGHGDGGGFQQALVEIGQAHGLAFDKATLLYQQAGCLFQQAGHGQQEARGGEVEHDMNQGNLQPQVAGGQGLNPVRQRQQACEDGEQQRTDHIEQQVHHGCALGGGIGARTGQQRCDAGADVLPEEDEHGPLQGNQPLAGQGLQNAHAGGG